MKFLQKMGQALMFPMHFFPVISIIFSFGQLFMRIDQPVIYFIGLILKTTGEVFIEQLPIIFTICIAYHFSSQHHMACLNGIFVFLIITHFFSPGVLPWINQTFQLQTSMTVFQNINNQFIGILAGFIGAFCFQKCYRYYPDLFHKIISQLILLLSTIFMTLFFSFILYWLWPLLYTYLYQMGLFFCQMGPFGAGLYGFFNRLLLPFGLHHPLNSVVWFDIFGINDMGLFWNSQGRKGITGMYQAGFFPIMMFGLPAAALAFYKRGHQSIQQQNFLKTSSFSSFFNGITEPIEFSILMNSPMLYLCHCVLCGLSLFLCSFFHITIGFGFSAGLIDYILAFSMPLSNQPILILLIGCFFFALYYLLFYTFLNHVKNQSHKTELSKSDMSLIVNALGGFANIESIDMCTTRLHIYLYDTQGIDLNFISQFQFYDVQIVDHCVLLVVGHQVYEYYEELIRLQGEVVT